MQIWVDADACPVAIKEILFRAAQRTGLQLTLVVLRGSLPDYPMDTTRLSVTREENYLVARDSESLLHGLS